jgi:hypothetical protein
VEEKLLSCLLTKRKKVSYSKFNGINKDYSLMIIVYKNIKETCFIKKGVL